MTVTDVVHIFTGPSAHGIPSSSFDGLIRHPPARRGSVADLLDEMPGVIALVDGTFHSYPSVAHAELRDAVSEGWQVWGLSSMGALRAAEMRHFGVRGYGDVYQQYVDDPEFDDDEVALIHGVEYPFHAISEPLIHIRYYLHQLREREELTPAQHERVIVQLKNSWYGDRTLPRLVQLLDVEGYTEARVDAREFGAYRLKTRDLANFMADQPWRSGNTGGLGQRAGR